ncbi:hypothetical protein [Halopenitus persicus]|uniref:hypothetical protein n=1 Tax=Halopenitus persicus TaxID=1048396 RepID=UPI00038BA2D4|nr:hypothetical protein [Halopenitus persicus]
MRALRRQQLTDVWDELGPWWDEYAETGYETAVRIADLLEQSNDDWEDSDAPFDADPLAADLTGRSVSRGPLRPDGEVAWSRWLAQLLRPSAALVPELFDVTASQAPSEVVREDQLSKEEGTFRRPDLLVFYADRGISIEVKLGDENYQKTSETAALVERQYGDRHWRHALLLPSRKKERLASIVDPPLDHGAGDRPTVEWDDPGPIDVLYWRDVTAAIRALLRRGDVVDEHWAANAYLFCAVAEQRLVGFQPQPAIERLAAPGNVVDTIQPIAFADVLEEQLTYFREVVNL